MRCSAEPIRSRTMAPASISIAWLRKCIMHSRGHMSSDWRQTFLIQGLLFFFFYWHRKQRSSF
jgi:hypothetical protein